MIGCAPGGAAWRTPQRFAPQMLTCCRLNDPTDYATAAVEHVRINHRRFDIFVAEKFLDGTNIVAILKQVTRTLNHRRGNLSPRRVLGHDGLEPVIGFRPRVRLNYELNEGREDGV